MQNSQIERIKDAIRDTLIGLVSGNRTCCFDPSESSEFEATPQGFGNDQSQQPEKEEEKEKKEASLNENKVKRSSNTSCFPQSALGVIIFKTFENEIPRKGSGILVGPDIVFTAAYNVYDNGKPIRKKYPYIRFIPGANGGEAPFGEIEVDDVFVSENYLNNNTGGDEENIYDYALLKLNKRIGDKFGYFGLRSFVEGIPYFIEEIREISMMGDSEGERKDGEFQPWIVKGRSTTFDQEKGLLSFEMDVSETTVLAGSGVFFQPYQDEFYVIGICVSKNSARLISEENLSKINDWRKDCYKQKLDEIFRGSDDEGIIKCLNLQNTYCWDKELTFLLGCGLNGLEVLDLSFCFLEHKGIEAISNDSKWPKLHLLDLSLNNIGKEGCLSLSRNQTWKNLKILYLNKANIDDGCVGELTQNESWVELRRLDLNSNSIGHEGAALLATCNTWKNLEILLLMANKIGDKGASVLATDSIWKNLKELNLSNNNIGNEGGVAIGRNITWKNLDSLTLSKNNIGDKGACAIGSNTVWTNLSLINLEESGIEEEGAVSIAQNKTWRKLENLFLASNSIGSRGAVALANNSIWVNLRLLDLGECGIGDEGGVALGRNVIWKQLQHLSLSSNEIGWRSLLSVGLNSSWTKISNIDLTGNQKLTEERCNARKGCPLYREATFSLEYMKLSCLT